jgi:hypothetical protein
MAMKERPKTPRDIPRGLRSSHRTMAEHFAERAKRAKSDPERCRYAAAAQRYRNLAKAEEAAEATLPPRKPYAPSA